MNQPSAKRRSFLATNQEVQGMKVAMAKVPTLEIDHDREAGTMVVKHCSGVEVYRAIQKGDFRQPWIVTHHRDLFVEGGRA